MKPLRQILSQTDKENDLGKYKPKSPDEQKFVGKHKIQVTADAAGNGDDVFKASNVKTYERKDHHGYNPGEDEKVYEDYIEEVLSVSDGMGTWIKDFQSSDDPKFKGKSKEKRREMAIAAYLAAKREAKRK